jgi:hypothetical protein
MQLCIEEGDVVTTDEGGVWVGDTVTTGGFPAVHPLTIIKPAMTSRRMNNIAEVFRAMVPDITGDMIIIWGNYDSEEMFLKKPERTTGVSHPPLRLPPNAITPQKGNTSSSLLERRGGKGGQALSTPSSYLCFLFHTLIKGILLSRNYLAF